jgi:hypothetical protein
MDGGMNGYNVFALTFQGANISKEAIELKSACVTSLIDGTRLDLEIVGSDASGESKLVPINKVQLIAPGAPLELKAKFGPAARTRPGKNLKARLDVLVERKKKDRLYDGLSEIRSGVLIRRLCGSDSSGAIPPCDGGA